MEYFKELEFTFNELGLLMFKPGSEMKLKVVCGMKGESWIFVSRSYTLY